MPRRVLNGVVVSDKQDKTVVVKVNRRVMHPLYKKFVNKTKKFHAHDEKNEYVCGQEVKIIESKPYSKNKKWEVV